MNKILVLWLLILTLFCVSCGFNGEQKLTVSDSIHKISIDFAFIDQIHQLCAAQILPTDYPTFTLYNQAVADCTFKNLSLINYQQVVNNCANTDTSAFTPEQLQQFQGVCSLVGN